MIKILLINLLFIFNVSSDYCDGFSDGYKEGYCYEQVSCPSPPVPPCPYMRHNEKDTYKDGYNRGFTQGVKTRNTK